MAQVTLYLDPATEDRMKKAAEAAGISQSRWVAQLIREKIGSEWPDEIRRIFGSWTDFPSLEELRAGTGEDLPREPV
jgi:hypothetical protein